MNIQFKSYSRFPPFLVPHFNYNQRCHSLLATPVNSIHELHVELASYVLGESKTSVKLSFRSRPSPDRTRGVGNYDEQTDEVAHAARTENELVYTVSLERGACVAK